MDGDNNRISNTCKDAVKSKLSSAYHHSLQYIGQMPDKQRQMQHDWSNTQISSYFQVDLNTHTARQTLLFILNCIQV